MDQKSHKRDNGPCRTGLRPGLRIQKFDREAGRDQCCFRWYHERGFWSYRLSTFLNGDAIRQGTAAFLIFIFILPVN